MYQPSVPGPQDFDAAYAEYMPYMYWAIKRMKLGFKHDQIHDLIQSAALKLSQRQIRYTDENATKALFRITAERLAIDAWRAAQVVETNGQNVIDTQTPAPVPVERELNIAITVHRAMDILTGIEHYIAWHYWALGFSLKEIAENIERDHGKKCNPVYVLRVLRRIKPRLKAELERLGGDKL